MSKITPVQYSYKRMEGDLVPNVQNISTADTFISLTALIAGMYR